MKNKIIWRKWKDPLAPLLKDKKIAEVDEDEEEDAEFQQSIASFDKEGNDLPNSDSKYGIGPIFMGPMGIVPLRESNLPSVLFNFWIGDTNFRLTNGIVKQIAKVDGVESLDVFTSYRFRLGIGRSFSHITVKKDIDNIVSIVESKQNAIEYMLTKKYPYWAIISLEDNKKEYVGGDSKKEVDKKLEKIDSKLVVKSW